MVVRNDISCIALEVSLCDPNSFADGPVLDGSAEGDIDFLKC
jgi:hypothetical protein